MDLFLLLQVTKIFFDLVLHFFNFTHLLFGQHAEVARSDHHSPFTSDAKTSSSLVTEAHSGSSIILASFTKSIASEAGFESIGLGYRRPINLLNFLLFLMLSASFICILAHSRLLLLVDLL